MFLFLVSSFEKCYERIEVRITGRSPNVFPMNLILLEALAGIFGGGYFALRAKLYLIPPGRR